MIFDKVIFGSLLLLGSLIDQERQRGLSFFSPELFDLEIGQTVGLVLHKFFATSNYLFLSLSLLLFLYLALTNKSFTLSLIEQHLILREFFSDAGKHFRIYFLFGVLFDEGLLILFLHNLDGLFCLLSKMRFVGSCFCIIVIVMERLLE